MIIEIELRSPSLCLPVEFVSTTVMRGEDGVGVPKGGLKGQVLKKKSDTDFDTEWQDDIAGQGGSIVTIEDRPVSTFPADTYIATQISELVNGAPATLDTLAKIATALGNDPNFATTILAELGKKIDRPNNTSGGNLLLVLMYNGEVETWGMGAIPYAGRVVMFSDRKTLLTENATEDKDAVNLAQMNEALDRKLDKVTKVTTDSVYTVNASGKHGTAKYGVGVLPYSLAYRRENGELSVGVATADDHAVPFAQLNEILAERIGDIGAALDEVHAYAQALVNGGATA